MTSRCLFQQCARILSHPDFPVTLSNKGKPIVRPPEWIHGERESMGQPLPLFRDVIGVQEWRYAEKHWSKDRQSFLGDEWAPSKPLPLNELTPGDALDSLQQIATVGSTSAWSRPYRLNLYKHLAGLPNDGVGEHFYFQYTTPNRTFSNSGQSGPGAFLPLETITIARVELTSRATAGVIWAYVTSGSKRSVYPRIIRFKAALRPFGWVRLPRDWHVRHLSTAQLEERLVQVEAERVAKEEFALGVLQGTAVAPLHSEGYKAEPGYLAAEAHWLRDFIQQRKEIMKVKDIASPEDPRAWSRQLAALLGTDVAPVEMELTVVESPTVAQSTAPTTPTRDTEETT